MMTRLGDALYTRFAPGGRGTGVRSAVSNGAEATWRLVLDCASVTFAELRPVLDMLLSMFAVGAAVATVTIIRWGAALPARSRPFPSSLVACGFHPLNHGSLHRKQCFLFSCVCPASCCAVVVVVVVIQWFV